MALSEHTLESRALRICNGAFVLSPGDAIVTVMCMPPPAGYFGLQTNVQARWRTADVEGGAGLTYPEVGWGDALNQLTIKAQDAPGSGEIDSEIDSEMASEIWDGVAAVITTADGVTLLAAREALEDAGGLKSEAINVEVIDLALTKTWTGADWRTDRPDVLETLMRYSVPFVDEAIANAWLTTSWPSLLIRAPLARAPSPIPPPPLTPRPSLTKGGLNESDAVGPRVAALRMRVVDGMAAAGFSLTAAVQFHAAPRPTSQACGVTIDSRDDFEALLNAPPPYCGSHYITRDALYSGLSSREAYLGAATVVVTIGPISTLLGKCTFNNLQFEFSGPCKLIIGRNDPRCVAAFTQMEMQGTSRAWFGDEGHMSDAEEVFAVAFGRSCPAKTNASGTGCHVLAMRDVPTDARIGGDGGRCYVNPTTTVGPPPDEMLMPTMLVFDPHQ